MEVAAKEDPPNVEAKTFTEGSSIDSEQKKETETDKFDFMALQDFIKVFKNGLRRYIFSLLFTFYGFYLNKSISTCL